MQCVSVEGSRPFLTVTGSFLLLPSYLTREQLQCWHGADCLKALLSHILSHPEVQRTAETQRRTRVDIGLSTSAYCHLEWMAAGAGCSLGPRSDLQAIVCCISMPLCNVNANKSTLTRPLCLLRLCSNLRRTPVQHSHAAQFHFTSSLMTSCPRRFQEHPSSSAKEGRKRGMKNEADRWSLELLIRFDDSEASQKVSEQKETCLEVVFHVIAVDLWSGWRPNCW